MRRVQNAGACRAIGGMPGPPEMCHNLPRSGSNEPGTQNRPGPEEVSMTQVTVGKWADKLAVALPDDLVQAIDLRDGERLDIDAEPDASTIRRSQPTSNLVELFRGKTPEEWRAEYSGAYDWGPDVGRETIPG